MSERAEKTEQVEKSDLTAWTPEAILQVRNVTQVRVSPDGKRVAYVVTDAVMTEEKSEFVGQIYLANTDGSDAFPATFGEASSGNPQWSPDGEWLAFTAKRGDKVNLYRMRTSGGEAEPLLTKTKSDVAEFHWSPDSKQIAFLMLDPKTEQEEKDEKSKSDWHYEDEDIKYSRLYVVSVEKNADNNREPRKLTTHDYQVGTLSEESFDWSPDGKSIVFVHIKGPKADDWVSSDISVVDTASGETRSLIVGSAAATQPFFSPDGETVAFVLSKDPPTWAGNGRIHLVSSAGGEPRPLQTTFNESPTLLGWSAEGQRLYFVESHGTSNVLSAMNVGTGKITPLNEIGGLSSGFCLNATRTHFGFARQAADTPVEAFVTPASEFAPVVVSATNAKLPSLPLGKTEIIRWDAPDGGEIEGLLTYPVGYTPGQRVPLILEVHGGPSGVFLETFTAATKIYPSASFAARGYAVLRPNPRGSTGYGSKFRHANLKDWGGADYRDLMAGVDHVIAIGVADPNRLGVMGWSYGGFMTSWIITQTRRFKAASIGAAVTNLASFTGTADIPAFLPDYFGAQPWDDPEIYRTYSPVLRAKGVTTPSLIQHCVGDIRVPISQGYEIYNALRQQNVPVRMLTMPRQTHSPMEPRMYRVIMESNLEWFEKYLLNME
ncbi:MAG: S9 family peptidase [Chthonomonadaceae bacterium]|nr:S9 family peptidase [Chthonomonadaceae bacterium]